MKIGSVIPEKSLERGSLQKKVLSNMSLSRREMFSPVHYFLSQIRVDLRKDCYSR